MIEDDSSRDAISSRIEERLSLSHLNKHFGDVQVLDAVGLKVRPGEIHGLAGQNGSGKSTLIKVLTGVYAPDPGAELEIDGRSVRLPVRWHDVHGAGLSVVHQDVGVLDQLSVAENVCVGGFPRRRFSGSIDRKRQDALCSRTLSRIGANVSPSTVTADLTAAGRAEVAIARAIRDHLPGEGLIILDEATRALRGTELDDIHRLLRRLVDQGSSVLMISHNLQELSEVADRVSVLKDGRLVAAGLSSSEAGPEEIARHMLGAELAKEQLSPDNRLRGRSGRQEVRVTELRTDAVHNVKFSVDRGEILGITGMPGSGYEEIPYALAGAQRPVTGSMAIGERHLELNTCSPRDCMQAGVVLIPERRDRDGLAMDMGVRDNICLPLLQRRGRKWFAGRAWQQQVFLGATSSLGIKTAGPMSLIRELSGGNQQKVLLAKWLETEPSVLVLHEPTQAVDIGARRDILKTIQRVAARNVAVVMVSSEAEDLTNICNRIEIFGRKAGLTVAHSQTSESLIDEVYENEEKDGSVTDGI